MNLKFYEVDGEYIKYLKENGDEKIPNIIKEGTTLLQYKSRKNKKEGK